MAPPLPQQTPTRADYSRDTDLNRVTLNYRDPTGEEAIRRLMAGGGPFQITAENGFRVFVNRETLDFMLLGTQGRVSRGGKIWLDVQEATHE